MQVDGPRAGWSCIHMYRISSPAYRGPLQGLNLLQAASCDNYRNVRRADSVARPDAIHVPATRMFRRRYHNSKM